MASIARVHNYWLGGKDNFQADEDAAEAAIAQYPDIIAGVRLNRAFRARVINYLAARVGVRQFLDIGPGLPDNSSTLEVSQQTAPSSRVVYVDNDPIVLSYARALLKGTREGACAYIETDLCDTATIVREAAAALDFSRPIAICLSMVLQFIPDQDEPWKIVRRLIDAVSPGSYLLITHLASDIDYRLSLAMHELGTRMPGTQIQPRSHHQVAEFFKGTDMLDPGLVQIHRWRPGLGLAKNGRNLAIYGGVGKKP